jgi:hypothetical protein
MRFWLAIILSTILISALLTFINEYQGTDFSIVPTKPTATAEQPQPEFVVEDNPAVKRQGYTFQVQVPPSEVQKVSRVSIRFKNQGPGPLEISFLRKTCGCADVKVDQTVLKEGQAAVIKAPGQSGELTFEWKPDLQHFEEMRRNQATIYRYGFELVTNERRYQESLRFEIVTELKATP